MIEPWPSTKSRSPRSRALDDEPLPRAGEEVGDDGVDRDAPAGDHDPGLAGGDEHRAKAARAGRQVELDGDGLLADGAVRADGEHDARPRA